MSDLTIRRIRQIIAELNDLSNSMGWYEYHKSNSTQPFNYQAMIIQEEKMIANLLRLSEKILETQEGIDNDC